MDTVRFSFDGDRAIAAVTGREGGCSEGEKSSLNLSYSVGDDPQRVTENRRIACDHLGFDHRALVVAQLVHGTRVAVVGVQDRGRGADSAESEVPDCDALITNAPMTPIAILPADCAPVLLHDPVRSAVGIAHAGWRGAIRRVAQQAVKAMVQTFGCRPADMRAGIGPCLQPYSLEVSDRVAVQAQKAFPQQPAVRYDIGHRPHLDIPYMIKQQLLDSGVRLRHVEDVQMDTLDAERFFSHRGQAGRAGRCMGVAMLWDSGPS